MPAVTPPITWHLLGTLEVAVDGRPVELGGPKQRAVLARLMIDANQVVSTDRLVEDLWGDRAPASAVPTLQAYISNLRRVLEPSRRARTPSTVLAGRSPGYVLAADPEAIDSRRFERLLATGIDLLDTDAEQARTTLVEALGLWRGPALSDFTYEPFAAAEIARLTELRLVVTEERIGADLACGRDGELVPELEHLVSRHPLRERLWRHLMLALYRSGRQAEALRTYRRLATHLADELGIEPSTDLQALEHAMLIQDPALGRNAEISPPAPARRPVAHPPDDLPIVGRDLEIVRLETALAAASEHHRGRVLLVEGEPGIGKSRLLEAMQRRARRDGVVAVVTRCLEVGRTPAFWPWVQAVRPLLSGTESLWQLAGHHATALVPFFPDMAQDAGDGVPPETSAVMTTDAWLHLVRSLCRDQPLALLVDDLYAADPDSLRLLSLVAGEIDRLPLVLVGSYRSSDLPLDHPLSEALHILNRLEQVERLPLRRLTLDETGELVRQVSGEVAPEAVRTIHRRTEGNAFFTVELARLLSTEGELTATGAPASALEAAIPTGVRDVIRRRAAVLGGDAVRLLRAAAVHGRQWDVSIVAPIVEMTVTQALDVVDEALAAGLIAEEGRPGWYRFSHVLIADTLADSLGALRRAGMHGQLATALEERHGSDPVWWVEIAHHAVEAVPVTGPAAAVPALARAARHALDTAAVALAAQLCQEHLDLVLTMAPSIERDRTELEALVDLAMVWTWRDGYHSERLATASERMMVLASSVEDPKRAAKIVADASMGRYSTQVVGGRHREAWDTAMLFAGLAEADGGPEMELISLAIQVVTLHHSGRDAEAVALAPRIEELIAVVEPDDSGSVMLPLDQHSVVVTYRTFVAAAFWMQGDRETAAAEMARARRVAERSNHPYTQAFAATMDVIVAAYERDHERVADVLAWVSGLVDTTEMGVLHTWLTIAGEWSGLAAQDGPADTTRLQSLVSSLDERGARVVMTLYRALIAEFELEAGRPEDALGTVRLGLADAETRDEGFWRPELERLHAEALLALGHLDEATAALDRAKRDAAARGQHIILDRIAATSLRTGSPA